VLCVVCCVLCVVCCVLCAARYEMRMGLLRKEEALAALECCHFAMENAPLHLLKNPKAETAGKSGVDYGQYQLVVYRTTATGRPLRMVEGPVASKVTSIWITFKPSSLHWNLAVSFHDDYNHSWKLCE
jgi:hypothetical protein